MRTGFKCNHLSLLKEVEHKSFRNSVSSKLMLSSDFSHLVTEAAGCRMNLLRTSSTMFWSPMSSGLQGRNPRQPLLFAVAVYVSEHSLENPTT